MWVRTTVTIERWTEENTSCKTEVWDRSDRADKNRLPIWGRPHLASVASSSYVSTFSSEDEDQRQSQWWTEDLGGVGGQSKTDSCCWKHTHCAGHCIHPFSDYGRHNLHLHAVSHCNCESRLKDCSEKTDSSSSEDGGSTCSGDGRSTCFNIIHTPCFELIPEEECVERIWYSWCKNYRPVSVAVIHHHQCKELNEEEEEEEESQSPDTQMVPTNTSTDPDIDTGLGAPDSSVPITIWRSESPTEKTHETKIIKKVKKKKEKEKEKDDEMIEEQAKLKKKATKKGKVTKKKSPVKSESSPADLKSFRELVRTSESSPESREELESEESYIKGRQGPSSEETEEITSSRKKEKCTAQTKKTGTKTSQAKKVPKRKSPPVTNPNLS